MDFDAQEYIDRQQRDIYHLHQKWIEEVEAWEKEEYFKTKKHKTMAEERKGKTKVIRLYPNTKATKENRRPVYDGYIKLEAALPAGTYKFGLWENNKDGKISYETTKIEPYVPQEGGSRRQSDNQYNTPAPSGDDLPF